MADERVWALASGARVALVHPLLTRVVRGLALASRRWRPCALDDEHDGDDLQVDKREADNDGLAQTAKLETPQFVFGRGFGRQMHPDEGLLVPDSPEAKAHTQRRDLGNNSVGKFTRETNNVGSPARDVLQTSKLAGKGDLKRPLSPATTAMSSSSARDNRVDSPNVSSGAGSTAVVPSKKRRVRIAWTDEEDGT